MTSSSPLSAQLFSEERTPASALATAQALPPTMEIYPEPDAAEAYDEMDAAAAEGDDAKIAAELGVEDWEDELSDLRRDVENIPARPRPRHVLPPPQTHSPSSLMDLETCARRYYYTYVFPVPFGSTSMEESQQYGSAVHAWIEDGMKGAPPKPERATGNGAVRAPTDAFATSEYALKASSYPLHEGADLPEQGPARMVEVRAARKDRRRLSRRGWYGTPYRLEDGPPPQELQTAPAATSLHARRQSPLGRRARENAPRLHLRPRRREGRGRSGGGLSRERRAASGQRPGYDKVRSLRSKPFAPRLLSLSRDRRRHRGMPDGGSRRMTAVQCKALILVVSRFDTVEIAVEELKPEVVGVNLSHDILGPIVTKCEQLEPRIKFRYRMIDSPMELGHSFERFEHLLSELEGLGYASAEVILDVTGGTTPMRFGAALAAMTRGMRMVHQRVPQRFVDGDWVLDKSKQREIVRMDNPLGSTGLLREGQAVELFNRRDYAAAALVFEDVARKVSGVERGHYYKGLLLISEGYGAWDVADYGTALDKLRAAREELGVRFTEGAFADRASTLAEHVKINLSFLGKVRSKKLSIKNVVDMFENARRRITDQGRHDDGVAPLYRCVVARRWAALRSPNRNCRYLAGFPL
jgi:hypothetical protein